MDDFSKAFAEIVSAQLQALGKNAFAAEKEGGLPVDSIRSVIRDDEKRAVPRISRAKEICDLLGLELYIGPPRDTAPVAQVVLDGADFASIPRIDAALAAGAGAENHSDAVIETLAFRRDWLNKNHVSPAAARLVRVAGDSMAPTLLDGDMVMIDTSRTSVRSGRVYAFRDHGETRVKRIELADEQTVILRSDNTGHPVEIRKVGQDDDFQILGQVVWSGHTWK